VAEETVARVLNVVTWSLPAIFFYFRKKKKKKEKKKKKIEGDKKMAGKLFFSPRKKK